jgi:hypothetical protein
MHRLNDLKIGGVVRVCGNWLRRSLATGLMLTPPLALPQIASPDIDPQGQPFSYPSQPTDEIGVMAPRPVIPQNGALVLSPSVETIIFEWGARPGADEAQLCGCIEG